MSDASAPSSSSVAQYSSLYNVDGQDEPYAIAVERKCCKICKDNAEFTDRSLKKHFMFKHPNVSLEFESVNSRIFVECSSCRVTIMKNIFERHKNKVHRAVNDTEAVNAENDGKEPGCANKEPYAIEVPIYRCKLCKCLPVKSKNKLKIHFEVRHSNSPLDFETEPSDRVKCSICGAVMFKKNFDKHKAKIIHSNLRYTNCNTEFVTKRNVENHLTIKQDSVPAEIDVKSDRFIRCSDCRADIKTEQLIGHKRQCKHVQATIRQEAGQIGKESLQIFTNQREETEEPYAIDILIYYCKLCKTERTNENDFKIHFKAKHGDASPDFDVKPGKRVKCSFCAAKMFSKNFNRHKVKVHQKKSPLHLGDSKDARKPYAIDVVAMKCKLCRAECFNEQSFEKHFAKKHRGVSVEIIHEKSSVFVRCSWCETKMLNKQFAWHRRGCTPVKAMVSSGNLKVLHVTNFNAFQKGQQVREFNGPLVKESEKYGMKERIENVNHPLSLDRMLGIGKNAHTQPPKLFGCRICDVKNIFEQNKMKHRLEHHQGLSGALNDDFYVADSKSDLKNKLKCRMCHVEVNGNHFRRHMRRAHSKSVAIAEKEPPSIGNQSTELSNGTKIGRQLVFIKMFECMACDARDIMEPNLVQHHQKKHISIPIEVNIFKLAGMVMRERCGICRKLFPESRVNQHMKRHHPKRLQIDPAADIAEQTDVLKKTRVQDTEPILTELYKCQKCKLVVPKDNIDVHARNHGTLSLGKRLKLIGTRKVIKCAACLRFIETEQFMKHIKQHKSLVFVSLDGTPLLNLEPALPAVIKQNATPKLFITQRNTQYLPKYRNIYKCRICETTKRKNVFIGDTDLDGIEIRRHQTMHRNHSIDDGSMFRLITVKVKCNECDQYLNQKWAEKHMKKVHNWNYDMNFTLLYKCGCCDAYGMSRRNLVGHHDRLHDIPVSFNKFRVTAVKQKIVCDYCGKRYMEGRPNKHNLKSCLQRSSAVATASREESSLEGVN